MNQVMEMLRLAPGATESDAIARLSTLFDIMSRSKGFQDAEVLHSTSDASLLLVLHSWDSIDDWTTFQTSDTKMAFAASRPAFLYNFEPCGINWLHRAGEGSKEGPFVHREVLIGSLAPASGPDVVCSETFSYQDYEPSLTGAMLRLTRMRVAPSTPRREGAGVVSDDVFESIYLHSAARTLATESVPVSR